MAADPVTAGSRGRRTRLPAVTGLRAVAALSVVFGHFGRQALPHAALGYLEHAIYWVDVFFVLSGFLLGYVSTTDRGLTRPPRQFLVARLARLYPAYLLGLAMALFFFVHHAPTGGTLTAHAKTGVIVVASLLMLQSWVPNGQGWNDPAWSLSAELFFYVVLALVVTWLWPRTTTRQRLLGAGLLSLVLTGIIAAGLHDASTVRLTYVARLPLLRVGPFLFAAAAGASYDRWRHRLPIGATMTGLQLLLSAATVAAVLAFDGENALGHLLSSIAALALIAALATGDGLVSMFLDSPPMRVLGEASYGVYIYQVGFFAIAAEVLGHQADVGADFWVTMALLVGLAIASARWFEPTARGVIERRAGLRRSPGPAPVADSGAVALAGEPAVDGR
jgi:peptidoglycan/LPS O-acetylase OafA/YrhL